MGGNALTVFTRRYSKEEYLELQEELVSKLSNIYNTVLTIPSYNNKETYGDLDLIVSNNIGIKHYLLNELNSKLDFSNYIVNTEVDVIKQHIVNYFNEQY